MQSCLAEIQKQTSSLACNSTGRQSFSFLSLCPRPLVAAVAAYAAATCSVDARAAPLGQYRGFGFIDLGLPVQESTGAFNH